MKRNNLEMMQNVSAKRVMNRTCIEREVLVTKVNGEEEETPMGPFYRILEGEVYTDDIVYELQDLNSGAIKAHEEAIEILKSYNNALSDKRSNDKEKLINDATGWFDVISKDNMERLAAEFYCNVCDGDGLIYSLEFLEEVMRHIDNHFDLDEGDSIDNIVRLLNKDWKIKTTELDEMILRLMGREHGRHEIEYYQQKAKTLIELAAKSVS